MKQKIMHSFKKMLASQCESDYSTVHKQVFACLLPEIHVPMLILQDRQISLIMPK